MSTEPPARRARPRWLGQPRWPTILVSHDYDDVAGLADVLAVVAEIPVTRLGDLGLERGSIAVATWAAEDVRVLPLGESSAGAGGAAAQDAGAQGAGALPRSG